MFKTFSRDFIVRDEDYKPIGRVVLAKPYEEGKVVYAALLKVPKVVLAKLEGQILYIDGTRYKVPEDVKAIKISHTARETIINSICLEPLDEEQEA